MQERYVELALIAEVEVGIRLVAGCDGGRSRQSAKGALDRIMTMSSRQGIIKAACNKFHGYYEEIKRRKESDKAMLDFFAKQLKKLPMKTDGQI